MSKQRKITELVGCVVEMKDDNKDLNNILGTLKGRISSQDLISL